jgi:hypothetical protein
MIRENHNPTENNPTPVPDPSPTPDSPIIHDKRGKGGETPINRSLGHPARNVLENRPQFKQKPVPEAQIRRIAPEQAGNSIPGWWDYMKQTSGGKGGAISRIAGGILQGLGNAGQDFAHGASMGQVAGSDGQLNGDPFGEGYRELQHGSIQNQQDLNKEAAGLNMKETVQDNQLARDERLLGLNQNFQEKMQDQNFRNSIDMLTQNFEQQKEMLGLTTEQQQVIGQFMADLKAGDLVRGYNAFIESGIDINKFADFVKKTQGNRVFDDLMSILNPLLGILGSDIYAKQDIKRTWEPELFWHVKKPVKELTRDDKLARLRAWRGA